MSATLANGHDDVGNQTNGKGATDSVSTCEDQTVGGPECASESHSEVQRDSTVRSAVETVAPRLIATRHAVALAEVNDEPMPIPGLMLALVVLIFISLTLIILATNQPSNSDNAAINTRIDLNNATAAELALLPGIGPSLAHEIIEHRTEVGGFVSMSQLDQVKGIGERRIEKLRPLLTIDDVIVSRPTE